MNTLNYLQSAKSNNEICSNIAGRKLFLPALQKGDKYYMNKRIEEQKNSFYTSSDSGRYLETPDDVIDYAWVKSSDASLDPDHEEILDDLINCDFDEVSENPVDTESEEQQDIVVGYPDEAPVDVPLYLGYKESWDIPEYPETVSCEKAEKTTNLPEVINTSSKQHVIKTEDYVKNVFEDSFYGEEIYRQICFVKVNEFRRGQIIEAFARRAKELGGPTLRHYFEKQIKLYISSNKEEQCQRQEIIRVSGGIEGMTNYSGLPVDVANLYCGNLWMATDEGIYYLGNGEPRLVCRQLILITAILKSADTGEEKIRLLFMHDGKWTEIICDKDVLASAQKITVLHKLGLSITSQNAKYMVAFLQDMEDCSRMRHRIPIVQIITRMGWNEDKTIFYPFTEEKIEYESKYGLVGLGKSLQKKGNRDAWYKEVKRWRKNPMVAFTIAASLSAPLLEKLGSEGFSVCLYGESRGGKSLAAKIACSFWAGFGKDDNFLYSANNTANAMDDILGTYGNLPVFLEDLNNLPEEDQKRIPQELAMKISNGVGKGRMTKDRKLAEVQKWLTAAVITSESRMTIHFHNAGSYNRVVQMEGASQEECPFTKDGNNPGEILNFFQNNHGFGGRDFIKAIKDIKEEELIQMLHEIRKKVSEKANEMGKAGGQELPVAVMLLADKIAEEHLFHDGVKISIDEAVNWMSDEGTVNQQMRFYDSLMAFVAQHSGNFEGWRLLDGSTAKYYGKYIEGKNQIAIMPSVLRELANEHSVDMHLFLKYLDANGLIIKDNQGNYTRPVYSKILKQKGQRMYVIVRPEQEEEPDDKDGKDGKDDKTVDESKVVEETNDEFEQMEIPFPPLEE